jgi:SAM-dependent methyltransferase
MSDRGLTFGEAAPAYHRYRPGYPDELVDLVLGHAVGDLRSAIEVGAGTGKATLPFARRGILVHAIEPDAGMRAVLEVETRGLPVDVIGSTFEAVDLQALGPVDLVFAAAAFHMTDPESRWERTASVLRSGGVAAFFGAPTDLADPELSEAVERIELQVFGQDRHFDPPEAGDGELAWPGSELAGLPQFTQVSQHTLERREARPSNDFVSQLSTVSQYLMLRPDRRAALLKRVREALPATVEVVQDLTVHLARRV